MPDHSTVRRVTVEHGGGDRWAVQLGQHTVHVDQPIDDSGPTPLELFVGSLTSCVAHYARGYLVRHDLPADGVSVEAEYEMAARPARVGEVRLSISLPEGIPEERRRALLAVAAGCTVHNTLTHPPEVSIDVAC